MADSQLSLKLRQVISEKSIHSQFAQIIKTDTRLNKITPNLFLPEIFPSESRLPTIANAKIHLVQRTKSHSQSRLQMQGKQDNILGLGPQIKQATGSKRSIDFSVKKLSRSKSKIQENEMPKQNIILELSAFQVKLKLDNASENKTQRQNLKESGEKLMLKLNEEIILNVSNGKIIQNSQYRNWMALVGRMKAHNQPESEMLLRLMDQVKTFTDRFCIRSGMINAKMMNGLCKKKKPSQIQVAKLFLNFNEIISMYPIPGKIYLNFPELKAKNWAATRIQAYWKMKMACRFAKKLASLMKKVKVIQKHWRNCVLMRNCRRDVMKSISSKIDKHHRLQDEFVANWDIIKTSNRVEIHISSFSVEEFKRMTISNLRQKQNCQLTRIFRAVDPDITVVYVTPLDFNQEVRKYYANLFKLRSSLIQDRIYFVTPENWKKFENLHLSTASLLLYSPKAMKRIKSIVGQKKAYIIPFYPSAQFINLSAVLDVPVLSSNLNQSKMYSTKSGSQTIFQNIRRSQGEKCPFLLTKMQHSIFSEKELINSLAVLIFKYPKTTLWFLKIQDEIQTRGLAYLDIKKISFLKRFSEGQEELHFEEGQMIKLIAEELSNKLRIRLKIVNKNIYGNYDEFLSHFLTRGGVVHQCPASSKLSPFSISFFIDPNGSFQMMATYNKLELAWKSVGQAIKLPAKNHHIKFDSLLRTFYKELWVHKKMFGFFTADFIEDEQNHACYAIGLDCFLNEKISSLFLSTFIADCHFEKETNQMVSNQTGQERHLIYCPALTVFYLPLTPVFFKNCRYNGIAFDVQKLLGSLILLLGNSQSSQLGILCVENSMSKLIDIMTILTDFLSKNHRNTHCAEDEIGMLKGNVKTWNRMMNLNIEKVEVNLSSLF